MGNAKTKRSQTEKQIAKLRQQIEKGQIQQAKHLDLAAGIAIDIGNWIDEIAELQQEQNESEVGEF